MQLKKTDYVIPATINDSFYGVRNVNYIAFVCVYIMLCILSVTTEFSAVILCFFQFPFSYLWLSICTKNTHVEFWCKKRDIHICCHAANCVVLLNFTLLMLTVISVIFTKKMFPKSLFFN